MEPEGSLPRSQQPATGPYPDPDESSSQSPYIFKILFDIIFPCTFVCNEWAHLFVFFNQGSKEFI